MIVAATNQQTTTSHAREESSIQKHSRFWDKSNKGYITPLDTISGFITLGYGMVFSITIGAFVSLFLSLSTQKGWVPDPLCRSKIQNLMHIKATSKAEVYDDGGVFNSDKFEVLFSKYAKADPSGNTITVAEFAQMTKEQEIGKSVKAWSFRIAELFSIYFFIGHRGYLSKEDVRAAYNGTLFYRLSEKNKRLIQNKDNSNESFLKGAYLSKSSPLLDIKATEHKLKVLLSSLQSNSTLASEYGLREWVSYIQDTTETIKKRALRRPAHLVSGVTSPKASMHRKSYKHEDPADLFPDGLTGVLKEKSGPDLMTEDYLSSLLSGPDGNDALFQNLTKDDNQFVTSSGIIAVNAPSIQRSPSEDDYDDDDTPLMQHFLRQEENDDTKEPSLTGVQSDDKYSSADSEELSEPDAYTLPLEEEKEA